MQATSTISTPFQSPKRQSMFERSLCLRCPTAAHGLCLRLVWGRFRSSSSSSSTDVRTVRGGGRRRSLTALYSTSLCMRRRKHSITYTTSAAGHVTGYSSWSGQLLSLYLDVIPSEPASDAIIYSHPKRVDVFCLIMEMSGVRDLYVASCLWSVWTFWIAAVMDVVACRSVRRSCRYFFFIDLMIKCNKKRIRLFKSKYLQICYSAAHLKPWLQLRFDYDTTTIRLRRIARACFHSTRFDASKKWTCQFFVVIVSWSYRSGIAIVIGFSQTRDPNCFTTSVMAADWRKPVVSQPIM